MTQGTPKTLIDAIRNGLSVERGPTSADLDEIIERHVRDFLAQRFSVAMLRSRGDAAYSQLWFEITGVRVGDHPKENRI